MKKLWPLAVVAVLLIGVIITYAKSKKSAPTNDGPGVSKQVPENPDPKKVGEQPKNDGSRIVGPGPVGGTDDAGTKANELFRQAQAAEKMDVLKAVPLYEQVVQAAPASEAAVQAAVWLGDHYYKAKEATKATEYLRVALSGTMLDDAQRRPLQEKLDELNSGEIMGKSATLYSVVSGDTLTRIANRLSVPPELIAKMNNIGDIHNIRIGEKFKVLQGPFNIVVEKGKFTLSVYVGEKYFKGYRVGLGKDGSTPEGAYKVEDKIINPTWFRPGKTVRFGDPANPLGTRWIKFSKGYGIHGTWEPQTVGTQASEGCVRMLNKDVEELFDLVVRNKSTVTVKP